MPYTTTKKTPATPSRHLIITPSRYYATTKKGHAILPMQAYKSLNRAVRDL